MYRSDSLFWPLALTLCVRAAWLQGIWLGGNLLPRLPANIGNLQALNTLSAPGNVLAELPASLGRLSALQTLALAGNQLAALPPGVSSLGAFLPLTVPYPTPYP